MARGEGGLGVVGLAVGLLRRKLLTSVLHRGPRPGEGVDGNGEVVGNFREPQLVAGESTIR